MKYLNRVLFLFLALAISSCYLQDDIGPSQQGLKLDENKWRECVGPGIYTDWGFFADLVEVNIGTLSFEVSDPSVATKDTQIVGLVTTIQARRSFFCEDLKNLYVNWPTLLDDERLQVTISTTASEAMKTGVRSMTLEELLNDRNGLSDAIKLALTEDALKYGVDIVNVSIKDIQLDEDYQKKLIEKAQITVQIEIAQRLQDQIEAEAAAERIKQERPALTFLAQLKAEKAKSAVELEIASREGDKVSEEYQRIR